MFRIKICGITSPDDARLAAAAGADAIGINFYARSKRYVEEDMAKEIAQAAGDSVNKVGVFVNAAPEEFRRLAEETPLDYVQLHGDEPPEMLAELAPLQVIKAMRLREMSHAPITEFQAACGFAVNLKAALLDAYSSGEYGGTGHSLDWESLGRMEDRQHNLPIILAGGLTPENVADAIRLVRPAGVDTASGVESSPGVKDAAKVHAFVANAARAFGNLG